MKLVEFGQVANSLSARYSSICASFVSPTDSVVTGMQIALGMCGSPPANSPVVKKFVTQCPCEQCGLVPIVGYCMKPRCAHAWSRNQCASSLLRTAGLQETVACLSFRPGRRLPSMNATVVSKGHPSRVNKRIETGWRRFKNWMQGPGCLLYQGRVVHAAEVRTDAAAHLTLLTAAGVISVLSGHER